jgi:S-formylglutathione hydrolase FrmB
MYSYVTEELPQTVFAAFPQLDSSRVSITGHSMGGHGALTLVSLSISYFGHSLTCIVPPQPWQV